MRTRNFWAIAAFCGAMTAFAPAQADDPINVTKWPDDVPCSALNKNDDGTFTLLRTVTIGDDTSYSMAAGNTFPTTDEYHVWATNCGS